MEARAEKIKQDAMGFAGCDITVRIGEIEPMLAAGWDAIPIGVLVWGDQVREDCCSRKYRKTGQDVITIEDRNGRVIKIANIPNNQTRDQMLDSYITRSIIGAKK